MGKCLTAGMLGFVLGMKYKACAKYLCVKQLKRRVMRRMGL